jgi:hypothetical protein
MPKTAAKKTGEAKSKKGASPYNEFMKTELAKLKKADPKLTHKYAPSMAPPLVFGWAPRGPAPAIPRRGPGAGARHARHAACGYVGLRRARACALCSGADG